MYLILCATIFCLGAALPGVSFGSETEKVATDLERKVELQTKIDVEVVNKAGNTDQTELELLEKLRKRAKKIHALPNPDTVERINMETEDKDLFQGDILQTDDQLDSLMPSEGSDSTGKRKKRAALNLRPKWDKVYYYIDDRNMPEDSKKAAQYAVAFWQNNTCIDFEYNATASDRIRVYAGVGCNSRMGRTGGEQDISLGPGCGFDGIAVHEFAHALGFEHSQCREDSDDYIVSDSDNMRPGYEGSFYKTSEESNNNYGIPYDFGSVMHYGAYGASIDSNSPVMFAKTPAYHLVMCSFLPSFYDVEVMNEHYNCKARCPSTSSCKNGGFPHPRDCSKCICPSGWGGINCDQRPPGCGADLSATESPQNVNVTAGSADTVFANKFHECNYLIKAPAGQKIEITIAELREYQGCYDGCITNGLEIKAAKDKKMTGIRYCCNEDQGTRVVSSTNELPIVVYNSYYRSEYTLTYRAVSDCMQSTV